MEVQNVNMMTNYAEEMLNTRRKAIVNNINHRIEDPFAAFASSGYLPNQDSAIWARLTKDQQAFIDGSVKPIAMLVTNDVEYLYGHPYSLRIKDNQDSEKWREDTVTPTNKHI